VRKPRCPTITFSPKEEASMPVSAIDETAALIVFDQQKLNRYEMGHYLPAESEWTEPLDEVIDRTVQLADAFRARGWHVVMVKVPNALGVKVLKAGKTLGGRKTGGYLMTPGTPDDFDDFVPELTPQPDDLIIVKPMWDPFIGTSLEFDLRQLGVTQLFLTGLVTSIGVESTARSGWNYGYNMVFVTDAMTDFDKAASDHTIHKIFPRLGENATTAEVLEAVGKTA
jgi:nicotinamidase-related amidase